MELNEDVDVPFILWRPILTISQALIDVKNRRLVLRVGEEEMVFKLLEAMKRPQELDDALFTLDDTNEIVFDCVQKFLEKD